MSANEEEEEGLSFLQAEYWASLNSTEKRIEICTMNGLECLRSGSLEDAVANFDEAQDLSFGQRYLWQRGVALFYLERYRDAAADLSRNAEIYETRFDEPATEERVLAAAARRLGGEETDEEEIVLKESRPVFRIVRDLFDGRVTPDKLSLFSDSDTTDPLRRGLFAHFYCGLYWEAIEGDVERAKAHMLLAQARAAAQSTFNNNDLSLKLPDIHLQSRGWLGTKSSPDLLAQAGAFSY